MDSPFKSQISVFTRMQPCQVTEEDPEVDLALNEGNGGLSEIGDSYEILRSSSSDQYTPIPQQEQNAFGMPKGRQGGIISKLMCTGKSLGYNEDEDSIFNEQQESPLEIKNNLLFNMPVDLGVDKLLVENILDNLTPSIDTTTL